MRVQLSNPTCPQARLCIPVPGEESSETASRSGFLSSAHATAQPAVLTGSGGLRGLGRGGGRPLNPFPARRISGISQFARRCLGAS